MAYNNFSATLCQNEMQNTNFIVVFRSGTDSNNENDIDNNTNDNNRVKKKTTAHKIFSRWWQKQQRNAAMDRLSVCLTYLHQFSILDNIIIQNLINLYHLLNSRRRKKNIWTRQTATTHIKCLKWQPANRNIKSRLLIRCVYVLDPWICALLNKWQRKEATSKTITHKITNQNNAEKKELKHKSKSGSGSFLWDSSLFLCFVCCLFHSWHQ